MIRSASAPALRNVLARRRHSVASCSTCSTPVLSWVRAKSNAGLAEAELEERGRGRVGLTDVELHSIRTLQHPPLAVRRLLEAVYWILAAPRLNGRPPRKDIAWERVQRLLGSPGFCE